ncbi:MAG: S8 family peptidase [Nitrososphaera sp.]
MSLRFVTSWAGNGNDCNGHGTYVAGTLGGRTFGVAKDLRIHALRVFGCSGSSPTSTITKAVDWVRANYVKPAVTNMSLGGGASDTLDKAVRNLTAAGVPVVVAAGNSNADANGQSPARVKEAITVGATDNTDTRAPFTCSSGQSNFGGVVDVFAPGDCIGSAWIGSDTDTGAISGTSMAAPHIAGMVARYLETDPYASPSAVSSLIIRNATNGVVRTPGTGSPNRLLYTVLPKPMDQPKYGNFDFDDGGKEDILVQSA